MSNHFEGERLAIGTDKVSVIVISVPVEAAVPSGAAPIERLASVFFWGKRVTE